MKLRSCQSSKVEKKKERKKERDRQRERERKKEERKEKGKERYNAYSQGRPTTLLLLACVCLYNEERRFDYNRHFYTTSASEEMGHTLKREREREKSCRKTHISENG